MKAGPGPAPEALEGARYHKCEPGSFSVLGPVSRFSRHLGLSHVCMADFLRVCSRFSAKDLPWRAATGKRSFFAGTFRSGQTRPHGDPLLLTSQSAGGVALLPRRGFTLLSPRPPGGCLSGCRPPCDAFGAPSSRGSDPAIDRAVTARLALRREAFRGLRSWTRQQIPGLVPWFGCLVGAPLTALSASIPPTVTLDLSTPAPRPCLGQGPSGRGSRGVRGGLILVGRAGPGIAHPL
ncbi:hypothetical protein GWK47_037376 [Chionoecetes opilio]|uniref:Uncharacterized protein n=1 Tax=Chionoecetes opilio TaxID=41210 RepID=A0A8J5D2A7_CHIOP|nr:hypothetical protein GWK47_037376 [Chionoecetes opilio]